MIRPKSIVNVVILFFSSLALQANELDEQKLNNWHQWRGPQANGVAPKGNPPTEWSPTKNIKWKVAVPGRGSASPIVWGDRIFILTAVKTDRTAAPPKAASAKGAGPFQLSAFQNEQPPTDANRNRHTGGET